MSKKDKEWLEHKIKKLDPEVQQMFRQVWKCDSIEDIYNLIIKWDKENEKSG